MLLDLFLVDCPTLTAIYTLSLHDALPIYTRFAGRAWSRFVDLHGGTLWRADFHAMLKPAPIGYLKLDFTHDEPLQNGQIRYSFNIQNKTVALKNLKLVVMLPHETSYLPKSSSLDTKMISDPQVQENMLIFRSEEHTSELQSHHDLV